MGFNIVCDSSADLPAEYAEKVNVQVVPFYVSMDGKNYLKEGVDISVTDFYQTMIDNADCFPKTSMPTIQDYIDAFLPSVKNNIPVICICLTKKFSGSMQSAINAKNAVEEEYKNSEIYVVDSMLATALQGLFVKEAVRLRDNNIDAAKAVKMLEEIRTTGHIFFTTKDLKYLQHGGRIGKVACIAGSMLNLKPVLHFYNGELAPTEICRGRKKSLQKIIDEFFTYVKESGINLKDYWFGTGIGIDIPEYSEFISMLEKRFKETELKPADWFKIQIGATIGVHTGPYPMGLGILKRCEI